jgi:hypothetical protein
MIPILGWGHTNEQQAEHKLYDKMLDYWESENFLPESFFDEGNTDVDYTVAGDWSDWHYVTQHIIPLTLEIYKSTGTQDWRFYEYNGSHNIYESDVNFFFPPENQIESVHRDLYNFEEHWLSLTPSIEADTPKYVKLNDGNKIEIPLKSGSQFFNTTDNAKVEVQASNQNLVVDYTEEIGTLFPTKTTNLPISLVEELPESFTLYVNITSEYASDLQLEVNVSATDFKATPGFSVLIIISTILILLPILRRRKTL